MTEYQPMLAFIAIIAMAGVAVYMLGDSNGHARGKRDAKSWYECELRKRLRTLRELEGMEDRSND